MTQNMSQNAPDRLAALDLLRLGAALAVVGFHYLFRGAAGEPFLDTAYPEAAPVAIWGYLGVNLFFLISGYVISASAEGRDWLRFSTARFTRIYPAFVICMTATAIVLWWAGDPAMPVSAGQYAANLLMFAPALGQPFVDGVYWSIILELVFYGWVALAVMLGLFDRFRLELVAGWLLAATVNEVMLDSGALRLVLITEYAGLFAAGMVVQQVVRHGWSPEAATLGIAAFVLSSLTMGVGRDWMLDHYGTGLSNLQLLLANVAIHALLIGAVVLGRGWSASPLIVALGGLTYPLYLLHQNAGYVAINTLAEPLGRWTALAIVTTAMLVLSWLVWRFAERPLRPRLDGLLRRVLVLPARLRPA